MYAFRPRLLGCVPQLNSRADKFYSIEEFVEDQDRHREKTVLPALTAHVAKMVELLQEVSSKAEQEKLKMESMVRCTTPSSPSALAPLCMCLPSVRHCGAERRRLQGRHAHLNRYQVHHTHVLQACRCINNLCACVLPSLPAVQHR